MTIEKRYLIEIKDVKSVEFECRQCHAKVVRNIEGFKSLPVMCGNCDTQLVIPGSRDYVRLAELIKLIGDLAQDDGERFTLKLEVSGIED